MLIQQITPDILKWIVALADAGHKPEAVMEAMHRSGWHEDEARTAIEEAMRGSLDAIPEPVPVPEPDLVGCPQVASRARARRRAVLMVGHT